MKKITKLLSSFLILSSSLTAQVTWNMIDNVGYGTTNNQTFALESFKGNFIAGTGQGNNPGAYIYTSSTGDTGTWVQQPSFTAAVTANDFGAKELATTTAAGGWIATGLKNYTTGPGVFNSPDGINWSSMGPIPYANPLGNYYEVSAMSFFNPSGADDTLFVAVQNGMDGAEIWKNYASGGTWTLAYDFPSYTASRVNDMVKFNNKLYATTSDARILESADGNNWTFNVPADTGFNDPGTTAFTAMAVFQNRLYVAATNSTTGTQIWNTSDGLSWSAVNINGFTNGTNMQGISDLMVANGKLWVSAYSWLTGGAIAPYGGEEKAMRGSSYYTYIYSSTNGTTFTNLNNNGFGSVNRSGNLGYFNGFAYQGSDNSGWGNGELWRICQTPTPSVSPANSAICEYAPVYFADTLSTASSYEWYVDGVLSSTATNFTHYPSTIGVQTIKLIERNGTCVDSISTTLTVNRNPITINTSYNFYCYGDTVHLFDTTFSGTAPFTYVWDDGVTLNTTSSPAYNFPATTGASYTVTVTDVNGCSSGANYGYIANASTDIYGHVNFYGGSLTTGTNTIVIYKHVPYFTSFDTVQVQTIDAAGDYHFTAINHGDYLIKVFPDVFLHPDLSPTYFGDDWSWVTATPLIHDCILSDTANITMIHELGLGGGPGFASGTITEGSGYGHAPTDPIPGVDVHLGKNPGGASMITTTTNSSGMYSFTSIPYNIAGEHYTVYVDIPGLGQDSSYSFVVDSAHTSYPNLDYYVDSTTIYITSTTGISNPTMAMENNFNVYPNPFKENATVEYSVNADAIVNLEVYDILGDKINELNNGKQQTGNYKYTLNNLHAGVYFIRLSIDGNITSKRVIAIE
jgi:hypothetical protein